MILITGGTGYIGSYLLYYLLKEGKDVVALKRKDSNTAQVKLIFNFLSENNNDPLVNSETLFNKIQWIDCDITDVNLLSEVMKGIDCIIHSAAIVNFNPSNRDKILNVNVDGTANIVNMALDHKVKKMVFISSVASLNRKHNTKVDETFNPDGHRFSSVYSESKYRAEMEVWRGMAEGLDVLIVNPAVVIGPSDVKRVESSGKLFKTIYEGVSFYPSGVNAFVDVRDIAFCCLKLMNKPEAWGQRFILSSENISYEKLIKMASKHLKVKPPKIKTGMYLGYTGWFMDKLRSMITGKPPVIYRDLIYTVNRNFMYSNDKVKNLISHEFIPVEKSVKDSCEFLLKQMGD